MSLAEIDTAIKELDQVTQQNVAMFEETTAASHILRQEAATLNTTMSRFQTGSASWTTEYRKASSRGRSSVMCRRRRIVEADIRNRHRSSRAGGD